MAMFWVRSVAWVERNTLGLDYRVIGKENLPRHGTFIVAAKHQSTFETTKLHIILNDPHRAETGASAHTDLGSHLKKTGMIPIDRGAGRRAVSDMVTAAHKAKTKAARS